MVQQHDTEAMQQMAEMAEWAKELAYAGAVVIFILFLVFLFGSKGGLKEKLQGFGALLIGVVLFFGFFRGGLWVGDKFGFGPLGALIGVGAFGVVLNLYKYFTTPKHLRKKSFF